MNGTDIKQNIKETYGNIAKDDGACGCSCGCGEGDANEFAQGLGYSHDDLKSIPEGANMALSCGNPTAIAALNEGETVLDLGSGGGFDCFLAANKVGESGYIIGVDMTPEMIARAKKNAEQNGYVNVDFRLGEIEAMPVEDSSVDVVISNCVINLSADKAKVFSEIHRVLKPGGRVAISDMMLIKELPEHIKNDIAAHTGCIAGALNIDEYKSIVKDAGFNEAKFTLKDISGVNLSKTNDQLVKDATAAIEDDDSIWNYITSVYVEAQIERLTN